MRWTIFGLFALLAACQMTPEQKAAFNATTCAQSVSSGSISTTGDRQHVPFGQAFEWCKAMQSGQPYTPVVGAAPVVRVVPTDPPSYRCISDGTFTRCRPM